jgi:lipoprotein-anchoring transpeptidase ErfK/SrfK
MGGDEMKVARVMLVLMTVALATITMGAVHLADGQTLTPMVANNQLPQNIELAAETGPAQPQMPTEVQPNVQPDSNTPVDQRSMRQIIEGLGPKAELNLRLVIGKTERRLRIYNDDQLLKTYHIDIGDAGLAPKERQGDHKTPEGTYYITERSILQPADYYLGTRWFRLSYPNVEDADRGLASGLIDQATYDAIVKAIHKRVTPPQHTALGGGVGIHGGAIPEFGPDWTFGCIGLTNQDVEDFFDYLPVGTSVIINH